MGVKREHWEENGSHVLISGNHIIKLFSQFQFFRAFRTYVLPEGNIKEEKKLSHLTFEVPNVLERKLLPLKFVARNESKRNKEKEVIVFIKECCLLDADRALFL